MAVKTRSLGMQFGPIESEFLTLATSAGIARDDDDRLPWCSVLRLARSSSHINLSGQAACWRQLSLRMRLERGTN